MRKSLLWCGVIAGALAASGCSSVQCGPGTKQVQLPSGDLVCQPVDQPAGGINCDVDAGNVEIQAGVCVSKIQCDPATTMFDPTTNQCVGIGNLTGCAPCGTPASGTICITGKIYDYVSQQAFTDGQQALHIAAYEPLGFLAGMRKPIAEDMSNTKGCYTFNNVMPPSDNLIAIAVDDPAGTTPTTLQLSGTGVTVTAARTYTVDLFALPSTVVAKWTTGAGIDYATTGAYVPFYYDKPVPAANDRSIVTTNFASGVTIYENNAAAGGTKYLSTARDTIAADTATTAVGGGTAPPPATPSLFGGNGGTCASGPCTWEKHLGGSAPGVIFFDRFFDCAQTATPKPTSCN
jgi:hypothetical protein